MTPPKSREWAKGVRLLSLLVAALLWVSVALERSGELKILVPVRTGSLPAGLRIDSPPVEQLEVTVQGPRILLLSLPFRQVSCALDLSGATAGAASFTPQEGSFGLGRELRVLRVAPVSLHFTFAKVALK